MLLLENTSVEVEILRDQVDWFNLFEKELTQVQEDLNFYNDILGKFTAEDIILLGLDSKDDITQRSDAVMTTADITVTVNITAGAVILEDAGIVNNNCAQGNDQHE